MDLGPGWFDFIAKVGRYGRLSGRRGKSVETALPPNVALAGSAGHLGDHI